MSNDANKPPREILQMAGHVPDAHEGTLESLDVKGGDGYSEKLVDAIEMIGEEKAAGFDTAAPSPITLGMRYLHSSRTIHQLVTDRNRAVGIYLAVASLLLTASGALYHANPPGELIIPIGEMQRWCLPIAFGVLTVLALFMAFLLTRTRVGLIYEVAKMNAMLGLPIGRVQRISVLSIHFILQTLVSCAGGASAGIFCIYMIRLEYPTAGYFSAGIGALIGILVTAALIALDIMTVAYTTSDERLHRKAEQK